MDPTYLPWGTLVLALFTFGIWMYLKQVEVVNKPPGPNMWLIVMIVIFLLALGFIAPLVVGPADPVSVVLSWVGIGGSAVLLLVGTARLLTGGNKN